MNSVYYYQKEKDGETYSKSLDNKEIENKVKQWLKSYLHALEQIKI